MPKCDRTIVSGSSWGNVLQMSPGRAQTVDFRFGNIAKHKIR